MVDFNKLLEYAKLKTEFDKSNTLHLIEMFIQLKFPNIKELELRYDKNEVIWLKFKKDNVHTKEIVQEELDRLKKEIDHYAARK